MDIFENAGFRTAPALLDRVYEARQLFERGQGSDNLASYQLAEAFSTTDFPVLLGKAFEYEAIRNVQAAVDETAAFAYQTATADFNPKKLRDLFGGGTFFDVAEGEEYKGGTLEETEVEFKTGKVGKTYGLTFELRRNRDYTGLANFPNILANEAVNTKNRKVFEVLVNDSGLRTDFFGTVDNKPLTPDNLQAAIVALSMKEDYAGNLVDTSNLQLLVPPSLELEANRIIGASELEMQVTGGTRVTKTRIQNPFRGLVTVVKSRWFAQLNTSATRSTAWALLPAGTSTLPSVIFAKLAGEDLEIRVKRDQGERVGGGAVAIDEGSFKDDTIWFRGRDFMGATPGFRDAVYGSAGQ